MYLVNGLGYPVAVGGLSVYWLPADIKGLLDPYDFCVRKGLDVFYSGGAPTLATGFY